MEIVDSTQWCKCGGEGTCMGCLIQELVRLHLGLDGENYLALFVPQIRLQEAALEHPRKALSTNLGGTIAKAISSSGMSMGMGPMR